MIIWVFYVTMFVGIVEKTLAWYSVRLGSTKFEQFVLYRWRCISQTVFTTYCQLVFLIASVHSVVIIQFLIPQPTVNGEGILCLGRPSVRPLTPISHDAIFLRIGVQWNLTQIFVSGHCWKGFQGQRSKVKVMTRSVSL